MEPYAVIETGSKQYRVKAGDVLNVELLDGEPGKTVELPVLAVSNGTELNVGTPDLKQVIVTATIVKNLKGDKIFSFRTTRRKNYQRKVGHRQQYTSIKIESIKA